MTEPARIPHILVVDDDAVIRHLSRALLERLPANVSVAENGADGLAMIGGGAPLTLVILDLDMPVLGGLDVLRRLRATPETSSLPVIVLTGSDTDEDRAAIFAAGANDYITKPLNPAAFLGRVKEKLAALG